MATAIPAADLKVFPSADDINAGNVGAGNIVTEENIRGLLQSLPPMNFVISGFVMARASDTTVTITAGEAFIGGYYVQTDTTQTYTVAPVESEIKALYFYLNLTVVGTVTGASISNSSQDMGSVPTPESALSVFLGVARTNSLGAIALPTDVEQSKRSYGGGLYSGTYEGTGDPADPISTLEVQLGFAPSFVYISGSELGSGSHVVSASGCVPAGARSYDINGAYMIGGFIGCGWCMVSSTTINTHPRTYTASTGAWTEEQVPANSWNRQTASVPGARPGDLVIIGGDNFIGTGSGGIGDDSVNIDGVIAVPASVYDADAIFLGPTGEDISGDSSDNNYFVVSGYVSSDDIVTWGIYNTDTSGRTPNPVNTGTITVLSAWELQTSTQFFLDTTDSITSELRPALTSRGFLVTRTPEGIGDSGETLNTNGQKYNYWAFS